MEILLLMAGIVVVLWILKSLFKALGLILTLGFLPSGIERIAHHRMMDGNANTVIMPIIGHLLNYISVLIINIIDFFCWIVSFIPFLNEFMYFIYRSPDLDLALGFSHRNFISHSILNPVFIIYLILVAMIVRLISRLSENIAGILKFLFLVIGLSFGGHLLADTMPEAWRGFALIKISFSSTSLFTLPALLSKLWLYINAVFAGIFVLKACDIDGE